MLPALRGQDRTQPPGEPGSRRLPKLRCRGDTAVVTLSRDELARLQRLRGIFLDDDLARAARTDYWRDDADLAAYARMLAPRIGWKWQAALAESRARGWRRTDQAVVLDYGCGTGIAGRCYTAAFGAGTVLCHDRSPRAMAFAAAALRQAAPGTAVHPASDVGAVRPDVLLVSHVLGELDADGERQLAALLERSAQVLWVEPGNRQCSRRLSGVRERLRGTWHILAPCPHPGACPALASADDWCHFFAPPPPEVFTDGDWVRAARELGIDQRALPYAFLAATRTAPSSAAPPHRVLGRPEVDAHQARVRLCTATGVQHATVQKRSAPALWRQLKKDPATVRNLP
ncbi:MAG: hypothetical protein JNK49_15365 [Planctomycetes bacterium]|nr:hypothetical protein [Planctomycetota bacterium]